ncbi:uncharacterized protein LOC118509954 [Anopheles stephensi]|uniref:uncharacterized protein LOC118509954 n=1 Tax=Anopheles stephensi TaxID=30069 RepID=UPI001658915C|nr:uncharacterized protein LOC118509954 [Anopheles stephensi]XP_035907208.1 uncharacterized protein LOC118509954 [Anopheles stephensi]
MNSNYVKKCTEFLQNIPAHKPAATNIAAAGVAVAHTDPSCSSHPQQPQSNGPDNSASKKTARRAGRPAGGSFGVGKRPVWRHPGSSPAAGFPRPLDRSHSPTHTAQHKFVRSCCPSRRPDTSQPGRGRVDCRWDEQAGKHPPPVGDMISDPIQEGRGDADNVNHSDGIGQTNVRSTVEIPTVSTVDGAEPGHNRPPEECQDRQPLSWSGILSKASPLPSVSERKDGTNAAQDNPECPNCQLLQRNWQDDRYRHAQESAQLTEQINYLQKQLRVNNKAEQRMEEAMKERCRTMEQDITKLKLAVDEKNVELVLINDLKRNLKEVQSKLRRADRERAELEKRLMVAQLENQKLELFLDAQALHLRKVKSELGHIHRLSIKQIEFLDDDSTDGALTLAVDAGSVARHHRHPSLHNYAPAVQSSECDTTTSNATDATSTIQSHPSSLGTHPKDHQRSAARRNESKQSLSSQSSRIVLEASTKRKSHSRSTATTFTLEESIPSLASDSDRDNADRVRMRKAASTSSSCTALPRDDNGKHNECADPSPGINRADHDDNRIRHRASTVSDYNAGPDGRRKLTAATDAVAKWQRDDKERHRSSSKSWRTDEAGDKYAHREEWTASRSTTTTHDDDHQQFDAKLDENITLPVSPRPFQHNLSIAQLSEDDSLTSSS